MYILARLSEHLSETQAAYGKTFRVTDDIRKPEQVPWRWLLEKFPQLVSNIMGVSMQKIAFLSFFTKQQQIAVKTISAHSQSTILIFRTFKKEFIW